MVLSCAQWWVGMGSSADNPAPLLAQRGVVAALRSRRERGGVVRVSL